MNESFTKISGTSAESQADPGVELLKALADIGVEL